MQTHYYIHSTRYQLDVVAHRFIYTYNIACYIARSVCTQLATLHIVAQFIASQLVIFVLCKETAERLIACLSKQVLRKECNFLLITCAVIGGGNRGARGAMALLKFKISPQDCNYCNRKSLQFQQSGPPYFQQLPPPVCVVMVICI